MFGIRRLAPIAALLCLSAPAASWAQVTPQDIQFLHLAAAGCQMPYRARGGDMAVVTSLLESAQKNAAADTVAAYRGLTHALAIMNGVTWTSEAELATALDLSLNAKVVDAEYPLEGRITFIFDGPAAPLAPYRVELEILKSEDAREISLPAVPLESAQDHRAGDDRAFTIPARTLLPGLHTLRATLKNRAGTVIYRYYRTFFVIKDLNKRLAALKKNLAELAAGGKLAESSVRYLLATSQRASLNYVGSGCQNLLGYTQTFYRNVYTTTAEVLDFDAELRRAESWVAAMQEGKDPLENLKGDFRVAYWSGFDGKLVPFRIQIPSLYDKSKSLPLIVMLRGEGGDENSFFDDYKKQWPALAEARGYILVAVNGRESLGSYSKESGGERDVLEVIALVRKHYQVDPARIFIVGHSAGATGAWRLGFENRDVFAAMVPIAGIPGDRVLEQLGASAPKIPVLFIAGDEDALVPIASCREVAEKLRSSGYPVRYLECSKGNHLSVAVSAIKDVFDFFDSHPRQPGR